MGVLETVWFEGPAGDDYELSCASSAPGPALTGAEAASLVRFYLLDEGWRRPADGELAELLGIAGLDELPPRHELVERIADELEHGDTSRTVLRRHARALPLGDPGQRIPAVDLRDLIAPEAVALSPRRPEPEVEPPRPRPPAFIDIVVVDVSGQPRVDVFFELVLPDATMFTGRTGSDGRIRLDGLVQVGECKLEFPELAS